MNWNEYKKKLSKIWQFYTQIQVSRCDIQNK